MPIDKVKIIIGVAAGKGGVGKSTLAVAIARGYTQRGYKTGILDADIYGPSIRKMLPEDILPVLEGDKIAPAVASSIKVISKTFLKWGDEAAVVRAPIANGMILKFIHDILWGELDILLIDFPPGTGDIQITLLQEAGLTGVVMVTTPQEVARMDVEKAMQMVRQMGVPLLGIVENMSFYMPPFAAEKVYPFGQGGGRKLAHAWDIPLLGEIPLDPGICEAMDRGQPVAEETVSSLFGEIGQKILERAGSEKILSQFELAWKDDHTFIIEWTDGKMNEIRLSDLQKRCPCAQCHAGLNQLQLKQDVKAKTVMNVGSYALRVEFTSGCSKGIYPFALLRRI